MSDDIIKRLREAIAEHPLSPIQGYAADIAGLLDRLDDFEKNGAQAVRWAPSSAHWSNELRRLFGPSAREGIESLEAKFRDATFRLDAADEMRDVLLRNGFVECDISACNCGSWHHRYGLPEWMREIERVFADAGHERSNDNGHSILRALNALIDRLDKGLNALIARLDKAERENERLHRALQMAQGWIEEDRRLFVASTSVAGEPKLDDFERRALAGYDALLAEIGAALAAEKGQE